MGPISPTNTDWIFGDNATTTSARLSFDTISVNFPLAWTDRIGYPVGTSIAWLDAIPLVAISPAAEPDLARTVSVSRALRDSVLRAAGDFGFSLCRRCSRRIRRSTCSEVFLSPVAAAHQPRVWAHDLEPLAHPRRARQLLPGSW
jgi:hypothetical protein